MSDEAIQGLEPAGVWRHFADLAAIPHGSGNEAGVLEHIAALAAERDLPVRRDRVGNLVVTKPGSPGREDRPTVVLQGHVDMVCEKNADSEHDFETDPIRLVRSGEWITADGTTLGADNGIGVALGLAALTEPDLVHPPLELLLTVDEETGLTGANGLAPDLITGRRLLNLDSEEEGALYIGCAGGMGTLITAAPTWEQPRWDGRTFSIEVSGLSGGHSGLDIHEGLGNAIRILARCLRILRAETELALVSIEGGRMHNAIPREARALVVVGGAFADHFANVLEGCAAAIGSELEIADPGVTIQSAEAPAPEAVLNQEFADRLLAFLHGMPNGVVAMSRAVPGLVETSTNLAVVKTGVNEVSVLTSQRSSVRSALLDAADRVHATADLAGFKTVHEGEYPGWRPDPDSELLRLLTEIQVRRTGVEPEVKAVHAGLECGVIGERCPGMDMISLGPDIRGAHSPDERVHVESVARTWDYLREVLSEL